MPSFGPGRATLHRFRVRARCIPVRARVTSCSDTRQRFGMEGETPKLMGSERKWPAIAKKKLSEKKEESSLPFEKETGNPSGGSAGAVVCMNLWRETMLARSLGAGLVGLLDEPSSRHARMPDWRAACIHALPTSAAGGSWEGMGAPVCSPMLPLPEQSRGSRGLSLSSQNHTYNLNVCAYSPEYGWGPPGCCHSHAGPSSGLFRKRPPHGPSSDCRQLLLLVRGEL